MQPNFRRFLPIVFVALLLLVVVPNLFRKKTSNGSSTSTQAAQTIDAMSLIQKGEQNYLAAHRRFTPHLADLLTPRLAADLSSGLAVQLDVGSSGQRYLAQVASAVLNLVRGRSATGPIAQSCVVVKSGSGVSCPKTPKTS